MSGETKKQSPRVRAPSRACSAQISITLLIISLGLIVSSAGSAPTIDRTRLDDLFDTLAAKNLARGSIAIMERGKLVYQRAVGNDQPRAATYRIGSITKLFTAVMVYKAIEEKKIALEDTLSEFFPGLPNAGSITIADMLGHRSGLARADHTDVLWGTLISVGPDFSVPPDLTNIAYQGAGPGAQHAVSLLTDGTVRDWGTTISTLTNVPPGAANVVSVSAGARHALALRADGTLVIWGEESTVPSSATNVVAIASGWYHNLALRADGQLVQWGSASAGAIPAGATNIVAFACGGNHSLALRRDGKLFAWGDNIYGQAFPPAWATNLAAVAGGSYNSLALVADGPPALTMPLVDRSVRYGGTVYFRASAVGKWPLSYQWRLNGQDLPGATDEVLTLTNAQPAQAGTYCVVVTNSLGTSASPGTLLTVVPASSLILPASLTVSNGAVHFLATSVAGTVWAVQKSTNLVDWTDAGTVTNTTGTMSCTGSASGFYRLRFSGYTGF